MARIEKTIFISYRRRDISWALAVYQYLTSQKYNVFFDYTSIPSGDFEQIIVSNIRARAHFILILTPTALDRCSEPGDWLRREIETAIDERRNIIPLFFEGFSFSSPSVSQKLTGKLSTVNRYNGLDIPSGYFMEAMERLRGRYLNVPLNAVLHPVPSEVQKVVKEEQVAADKALQQREDIKELVKPAEEKPVKPKQTQVEKAIDPFSSIRRGVRGLSPSGKAIAKGDVNKPNLRPYGIGAGILLVAALGIAGINSLIQNIGGREIATPTQTNRAAVVAQSTPTSTRTTSTPTLTNPTSTATTLPFTPTSEYTIGSTMTSPKDSMTLLYVPAGDFTMGSDDGDDDEKPAHTIYLDTFWIDQTEVTNAMYAMCVGDDECDPPNSTRSLSRDGYYGNNQFDNFPVIYASWNDANAYCSWADRRLPTEAEWEKAASWDEKNQLKHKYPWGDDFIANLLNFCDKSCSFNHTDTNWDDGYSDTSPVGNYLNGASFYGALDMAGNVWEWVSDWYDSSFYNNSPPSNPQGPASGQKRILRGGSWFDDFSIVHSFSRLPVEPSTSFYHFGIRCARSE
jgi:formylglycine-generating enzyme required for sulfatase activity